MQLEKNSNYITDINLFLTSYLVISLSIVNELSIVFPSKGDAKVGIIF